MLADDSQPHATLLAALRHTTLCKQSCGYSLAVTPLWSAIIVGVVNHCLWNYFSRSI